MQTDLRWQSNSAQETNQPEFPHGNSVASRIEIGPRGKRQGRDLTMAVDEKQVVGNRVVG